MAVGGKKADLSDPREAWEAFFRAVMKNDWKGSLGLLEGIKKLEPGNPQVFMKLGDVQQRLGNAKDAVTAYHKAAVMAEDANEFAKALATYKVILRLVPDDGKAAQRSRELAARLSSARQQALQAEEGAPEPEAAGYVPAEESPASAPDAPKGQTPPAQPDLKEAFSRHPIFSVLSDDEIKHMSRKARHVSFKDGQKVIEEDTDGDSIYVIKKGRAGVTTEVEGQVVELASLGGLAFFGEGGFLTGGSRAATVTARGQLDVMEIPRDLVNEMVDMNPLLLKKLVDLSRVRTAKGPRAS